MPSTALSVDTAKFAVPAIDSTLPRPALLEQLAAVRTPCKWLSAAPGSGKSTLAAEYARSRKRSCFWYRLEKHDAEPAFLFGELARAVAARAGAQSARALPRLSDADRAQPREFAQRFFRAVLTSLGGPLLLVFDDVNHAAETPSSAALAGLIEMAAAPNEILLLGTAAPERAYWDAIGRRQLSICNDVDLRFGREECEAIAGLQRLRGVSGEELAVLTGGHAAALILACEFMRSTRQQPALATGVDRQLHAFLLDKVMAAISERERDVLLHASLVPQITPDLVAALADLADAAEATGALDSLAQRGLLVRHVLAEGTLYEAHGLVRAGARTIAQRTLGEDEARRRALRCAQVLQTHGLLEDAFALWLDLDAAQAAALLEPLAQRYARERQPRLAQSAAERLPAAQLEARPWISFWTGHALLGNDDDAARAWFERSFAAFERLDDAPGMALAAASVMIGYGAEEGDLSDLQTWVARFQDWRPQAGEIAVEALRSTLLLGVVCAANVADEQSGLVADADAAVTQLSARITVADAWISPDQQMTAAMLLLAHVNAFSTLARARQIALMTEAAARDERQSALLRGRWWLANASLAEDEGDRDRMAACLGEVERLVQETQLRRLDFALRMFRIDAAAKHSLDGAATQLAEAEHLATQLSLTEMARFSRLAARVLTLQRRWPEAIARAEAALELAHQAGIRGGHARVFEVWLAYSLAGSGRAGQAADRLAELDPLLFGKQRELVGAICGCLRHLAAGADTQVLTTALGLARENGFHALLQVVPEAAARISDDALALDIETDFVHELIAYQRLQPPPGARPTWPWPVRVWTLGEFRLEIGGSPYRPERKAQDKPLELLQLLLAGAAGGRRALDKTWIAEQLWPDADAGNARKSLDMAVMRLRKVLQSDPALEVVEGRLRLGSQQVWSDVSAMRFTLVQVQRQTAGTAASADSGAVLAALQTVLALYRGPFLRGEVEAPWLLGARAHLAREFCAAVAACGQLLGTGDTPGLALALERALLAEPASEDIARLLMRAYLACGENAEALRVYQHCRQMLSITLGVAPSAQTELLRQQVYAAAAAGRAVASGAVDRA